MTTPRQRMLDAFEFSRPDRIPVVYHPSPAGLHVHGKKLLDLFNVYPPDNPIRFDSVPHPDPKTIDEKGEYHEFRKDEWGTEREFRIFGIAGHPRKFPFPGWDAAGDYRFPPIPPLNSRVFAGTKKDVQAQQRNYLVFRSSVSIFERLCALRPMDEVLMDLLSEEPNLMSFLDRMVAYWQEAIDYEIRLGADVIMFGDDWGTQSAPIVSPEIFREVFMPRYRQLMDPIQRAGRKIMFHSCGFLGEILDELFRLGINGLWPQIALCDRYHGFVEMCRERQVAIYIHPDRQRLIPLGTPAEIETAIRQYADRYRELGGGGIFYVEIENDAPFENVKALIESVHKFR